MRVSASPAVVERCLAEARIGFFFAPTFHPSMRHAAQTRSDLGVRTAFNLLGPLTNPAGATRQLVGVPRPELTELMARALMLLGSDRAWVVHGADGIDEISTHGLHEDLRVPRRRREHFLSASLRGRIAEGGAGRAPGRRLPTTTRRSSSGCWPGSVARPATSCCSMREPRCSSPESLHRWRTASCMLPGRSIGAMRGGRSSSSCRSRRPRSCRLEPDCDGQGRRRRPARDDRRRDPASRRGA